MIWTTEKHHKGICLQVGTGANKYRVKWLSTRDNLSVLTVWSYKTMEEAEAKYNELTNR